MDVSEASSLQHHIFEVPERRVAPGVVIARVENLIASLLDDLIEGQELYPPIPVSRGFSATLSSHPEAAPLGQPRTTSSVSFPGKSHQQSRKIARVLKILQLSHAALVTGTIITKRNIYYQDEGLFREQRVVDALVDQLACSLGLSRDALCIVAASKGLVVGHLDLIMKDHSVLSCSSTQGTGSLIPPPETIRQMSVPPPNWVLIVEKEATFRSLAASRYWKESLAGPGIILTGKGYPDLATRQFVFLLHSFVQPVPFYVLVDFDPHGVDIFRVLKKGSSNLSHEQNISIPSLRWLGIRCKHLAYPSFPTNVCTGQVSRDKAIARAFRSSGEMKPLTMSDRQTAARFLTGLQHEPTRQWEQNSCLKELQMMQMLGYKAEIQAVDKHGDLTDWLDAELLKWESRVGPECV